MGYNFQTRKYGGDWFARGNLRVGPLYGYGDDVPDIGGWTLGALPSLEIGYKKVSVEISYMPLDGGVVIGVIKFDIGR